jgi:hypothetical protein
LSTVGRVFAVVVFIGMLVQSTGLSLAASRGCDGCGASSTSDPAPEGQRDDGCDADEQGGDCSPECERCLCCAHHRVVALPRLSDSRPAVSQALPPITAPAPDLSSDPGEILHVPKRSDSVS